MLIWHHESIIKFIMWYFWKHVYYFSDLRNKKFVEFLFWLGVSFFIFLKILSKSLHSKRKAKRPHTEKSFVDKKNFFNQTNLCIAIRTKKSFFDLKKCLDFSSFESKKWKWFTEIFSLIKRKNVIRSRY